MNSIYVRNDLVVIILLYYNIFKFARPRATRRYHHRISIILLIQLHKMFHDQIFNNFKILTKLLVKRSLNKSLQSCSSNFSEKLFLLSIVHSLLKPDTNMKIKIYNAIPRILMNFFLQKYLRGYEQEELSPYVTQL